MAACKKDGFSTPEFRYDASGIWTIFNYEYPERAATQKTTQKTTQKDNKKTNRKQSESDHIKQEEAILKLIKENPDIQRKTIVSRLGIHDSSVKRRLASLQEKGVIRHIGPNKGGYWQIIK